MRSKPAGSMTVQEQNALFPNNVDLRLKKALGKKVVDTDAQKDLDGKLEQDDLALQHQKYLINGVLSKFRSKNTTTEQAHKNLVSLQMQKWMESHIVSLSDRTRVGDTTWRKVKKQSMADDYKEQRWFKQLTVDERKLVRTLRKAQKEQGDMERLQPQPYDADNSQVRNSRSILFDPLSQFNALSSTPAIPRKSGVRHTDRT